MGRKILFAERPAVADLISHLRVSGLQTWVTGKAPASIQVDSPVEGKAFCFSREGGGAFKGLPPLTLSDYLLSNTGVTT